MTIYFIGAENAGTLDSFNDALIASLTTSALVTIPVTHVNPFFELLSKPEERAGGTLSGSRLIRDKFTITDAYTIEEFTDFQTAFKSVISYEYHFIEIDYYEALHSAGYCVPIEIMQIDYINVGGYKQMTMECRKKYI